MNEKNKYVTVSEAARIAGVSATWIRRLCDEGRLPVVRTPLGRLVEREAVEDLAATREARARGEE